MTSTKYQIPMFKKKEKKKSVKNIFVNPVLSFCYLLIGICYSYFGALFMKILDFMDKQ